VLENYRLDLSAGSTPWPSSCTKKPVRSVGFPTVPVPSVSLASHTQHIIDHVEHRPAQELYRRPCLL